MLTRRKFLAATGLLAAGWAAGQRVAQAARVRDIGLQLYTVRTEMLQDAKGTLARVAQLGYKEIESASSAKGHYYGLSAKEIKQVTRDLGLTLRSGHVQIDEHWARTIDEAAEAGQQYLICSTMPSTGQTASNYERVADVFNKSAEACRKAGLLFGYHNHEYEFEQENGQIFYDILLAKTDPTLVHMELDLGWVVAAGQDPLRYFERYPGRFPLWHLKDVKPDKAVSTELGTGRVPVVPLLQHAQQAGLKYFFVEQEDYQTSALDSARRDIEYLRQLTY
ncbi:sugar phosphate isomerase/epimerase family protein [Hymenobacter psoromatis]|uniref:sugar phosphate isomerase/epimerase family protein n=1 Tax=Hymenobacter psoromatis TaxID=1484116 RepID=UPI001CBB959D|nr:sugar phosphate isomerase/epimerase [Hymenobacter psoromatis]